MGSGAPELARAVPGIGRGGAGDEAVRRDLRRQRREKGPRRRGLRTTLPPGCIQHPVIPAIGVEVGVGGRFLHHQPALYSTPRPSRPGVGRADGVGRRARRDAGGVRHRAVVGAVLQGGRCQHLQAPRAK
eukprot:scaffold28917_cov132-Isochrysis_galbana.AAC.3